MHMAELRQLTRMARPAGLRRMRKISFRAVLALIALLALHPATAGDERTWIVGATVISPDRADDGRLVAANLSLRQLLEAATLNNAKAFGLADRVGTI